MAKKKNTNESLAPKIPVNEIELGGVYKTYVNELVQVLQINGETNQFLIYNISGAHKQWIDFKYIYLTEKIRNSR